MRTLFIAVVLCAVWLTASADPAPSTHVTVTGPGVGISQMNGGTIQTGLTPEEVAALAKATGEELVRNLTRILERSFAQQGLVSRQICAEGTGDSSHLTRTNSPQGCELDIRALGTTAPPAPFDGQRLPPSGTTALYLDVAGFPFNTIYIGPST